LSLPKLEDLLIEMGKALLSSVSSASTAIHHHWLLGVSDRTERSGQFVASLQIPKRNDPPLYISRTATTATQPQSPKTVPFCFKQ
jgi:hypothetical protein